MAEKRFNPLPGFKLTMGCTLFYLSVLVLVPVAGLFLKAFHLAWPDFWRRVTDARALAAYRLTFGASLIAAFINVVFGALLAWILVRYRFFGGRFIDALIDFPFALPTAVAGLTLASLFAANGWLGRWLVPLGINAAYTPLAVVIALTFVGLPFVVRTLQPVLQNLEPELEEAAATLGAGRLRTFFKWSRPRSFRRRLRDLRWPSPGRWANTGPSCSCPAIFPSKRKLLPTSLSSGWSNTITRARRQSPWFCSSSPSPSWRSSTGSKSGRAVSTTDMAHGKTNLIVRQTASRRGTEESPLVKWTLISIGLAFALVFLLLPLANVFCQAFAKGAGVFVRSLADTDSVAAIRLTLLVAVICVPLNLVFGVVAAWAIAKFNFRGKAILITLIDLPFAVSPVVSGLIFVLLFGLQGYFGPWLADHDIKIIFAVPGIVLATLFVTFPFVARELIPVMQAAGSEQEQAALTLGASGWQTFWHVTLPSVKWGLLYGVILCNARAMGEFGAVSVVSGHIAGETNTMPLHIEKLYNEYNGTAAFAVASLLALLALVTLGIKTAAEWRMRKSDTLAERPCHPAHEH